MDEYEQLEDELKEVYQEYIRKFRCLAYLEQQLEELERLENEEKAVSVTFYRPYYGTTCRVVRSIFSA